jgi:predicted AAA+ superfamily ATPase
MNNVKTIFIDEIQNIEGWKRFVRRIYDEGYKIFITGANARLLSSELGTHLTGRYSKVELYPFSFSEYLNIRDIKPLRITSDKKADILKSFEIYLECGGFPEYLKYSDTEFLKRAYDDIIYRDIIARHGIQEVKSFLLLVQYIFTNAGKDAGYASLAKDVGIKSPVSVRDYISFLEGAYLVFELYRYDTSLKSQYSGQKKMYVINNGMRNTVFFRFSKDNGSLLENMILIELKRRESEIFFLREKNECDFIIYEGGRINSAIQVSYVLNRDNLERETKGLCKAMESLNLKSGIILTYNQEEEMTTEDGKIISIIPAWRWLPDS